MNSVLAAWNASPDAEALDAMLACCGARRWAEAMVALRPIETFFDLSEAADKVWSTMEESDRMEAFAFHPRIGERKVGVVTGRSSAWSREEQASTLNAAAQVLAQIVEGNRRYEQQFGFTYIVCATGKSAQEMLAILNRRLAGTRESELREAAEQQRQILQIRLRKWLAE